jgi:hypothetical protein
VFGLGHAAKVLVCTVLVRAAGHAGSSHTLHWRLGQLLLQLLQMLLCQL